MNLGIRIKSNISTTAPHAMEHMLQQIIGECCHSLPQHRLEQRDVIIPQKMADLPLTLKWTRVEPVSNAPNFFYGLSVKFVFI